MKKGIINIIGQIGSYKDSKGEIKKGIELVDVMKQVTDAGEVDEYIALVNSKGGRVIVGNQISDYLKSLKNLSTVIYKQSASMGTKISMAAKKEKRYIIKGASFFIHNPWTRVEGDASELKATAEELQEAENEMASFYIENSNLNRKGVEPLMKQQTSLTDEQAVSFGFAGHIITEEEAKAMGLELLETEESEILALIETKPKTDNMSAVKEFFNELTSFMKKQKVDIKAELKTLEVKTQDGKTLSFQTEDNDIKIGDQVSCEGKLASEKEYVLADGRKVRVNEKAEIWEVIPVENKEQPEYAKLQAENDILKKELSEIKAQKLEDEKGLKLIKENFNALAKQISSKYEPEQAESNFRKHKEITEDNDIIAMAKRKSEEAKTKKAKQQTA